MERRQYGDGHSDPHTCPIGAGHYKFASNEDLQIYLDRVSAERMEAAARHLIELGPGSELAEQIKKHRGAEFLEQLRQLAMKLRAAA